MIGKIDQTWWRVLPAKFVGGFLCILGGLALGRKALPYSWEPWWERALPDILTGERRRSDIF